MDVATLRSWLSYWREAYTALLAAGAPLRLHPHRRLYYERAMEVILDGSSPHDVLWPLWRTWTHAICSLPGDAPYQAAWQKAGEQLGLLGDRFLEKITGLDAYLDMVDETLETWAKENGG